MIRILTTVAIAFGDKLNVKEKVRFLLVVDNSFNAISLSFSLTHYQIFVAISWMSKATVQAALGPVALKTVMSNENRTEEEVHYAELVKMVCILSIILTAPLGAILISVTGTKLLKKTKQQLEPLDGTLGALGFFFISSSIHSLRTTTSYCICFIFQAGGEVIGPRCTTSVSSTRRRSGKISRALRTRIRLPTRCPTRRRRQRSPSRSRAALEARSYSFLEKD